MSLLLVENELADRLGAIDGLRVYRQPPEGLPELPAAIIQPGEPLIQYDRVLGGADASYRFAVLLLVQSAAGEQAWEAVAAYVNPTGEGSVKAAVEAPLAIPDEPRRPDWFRVVKAGSAGPTTYRHSACWGVTFQVQAYVSG